MRLKPHICYEGDAPESVTLEWISADSRFGLWYEDHKEWYHDGEQSAGWFWVSRHLDFHASGYLPKLTQSFFRWVLKRNDMG